ncbi:MAG TPA: hypothetical protein VEC12_13000 [Bacteroidia bacterium]|nr:hypothetical protein [Bacteroidia bacterium]
MVSSQKISSYLRKPFELNAEAETNLEMVVAEYPYFNNAWLLLARTAHNLKSPGFDTALKQASMYAGERKLLYKLVNIDEKELPGPTLTEALKQKQPVAPANIHAAELTAERETAFEAPFTPKTNDEDEADTAAEKTLSDAEKLASAYDEIFGTSTGEQEDLTVEFESFDSTANAPVEVAGAEEPSIEATRDIADEVSDSSEITTPVDELLTEDIYSSIIIDEEDDHELAPLFAIDEDELPEEEEENKIAILEAESGKPVELEAEETVAEPAIEQTGPQEEEKEIVASTIERELIDEPRIAKEEIEVPIAFKLEKREEPVAPAQVEPRQEEEKPVLVTPGTFFEWLAQLKKLQGAEEKKTEHVANMATPAAQPAVEEEKKTEVTSVTEAAPAKKSSVDDIIDKFIKINPTISRPKAEFYNPAAKSKESDTPADDLATETLAKIYLSQNLFERAISTYERLAELNPGKASKYREMIQEIESNLQG